MFDSSVRILQIKSVYYGNRVLKTGDERDYSGRRPLSELVFKYDGFTQITVCGKTFTEGKGQVRYMPPCVNDIYHARALETGSYCYFQFEGQGFPNDLCLLTLSPSRAAQVGGLFKKLNRIWCAREEGYEHLALSVAYEILAELRIKKPHSERARARLAPALEYIGNHLTEEFSLGTLPALCSLGGTRFGTLFREAYGKTPSAYVADCKLQLACDRLEFSDAPIAEIAQDLGYADPAYFAKLFKAAFGCTASQFRKEKKKAP